MAVGWHVNAHRINEMKPFFNILSVIVAFAFISCSGNSTLSDSLSVSVTHTASVAYNDHPVVIDYKSILALRPDWAGQSLSITDPNGAVLASQIDDMDSDGTPDEFVFIYTFDSGSTTTFQIQPGIPAASPYGKTDARNWKRPGPDGELVHTVADTFQTGQDKKWYRYDGPGWENEIIGWRIYFDGRNATDIWGKRTNELFMERLGTSTENYEQDLP